MTAPTADKARLRRLVDLVVRNRRTPGRATPPPVEWVMSDNGVIYAPTDHEQADPGRTDR
ncbi:hypothetical protein FHS29_004863 [Saccharothrix tamanrassetensis]|uniref:Uncharacterized protein n=1 Tax=Saccharothrix tamanrassetensis TaxID=1051531 RepID=A0A841CQI2_9PSEU|nr:hypothetical protein [Saccharothrix tamanrassetensis]MBB5958255.1 hypothetical protein [Saccharothrix tamanrassetensis]